MARVHAVGLFDETDGLDSNGADVDVVTNVTALDATFEALKMRLIERLGSPTDAGAWEQPMMHDRRVHRIGYSRVGGWARVVESNRWRSRPAS